MNFNPAAAAAAAAGAAAAAAAPAVAVATSTSTACNTARGTQSRACQFSPTCIVTNLTSSLLYCVQQVSVAWSLSLLHQKPIPDVTKYIDQHHGRIRLSTEAQSKKYSTTNAYSAAAVALTSAAASKAAF